MVLDSPLSVEGDITQSEVVNGTVSISCAGTIRGAVPPGEDEAGTSEGVCRQRVGNTADLVRHTARAAIGIKGDCPVAVRFERADVTCSTRRLRPGHTALVGCEAVLSRVYRRTAG